MGMCEKVLRDKFSAVRPMMNERQRQILAAIEPRGYGCGNAQAVARASGMSRQTIYRGLEDLEAGVPSERACAMGGAQTAERLPAAVDGGA